MKASGYADVNGLKMYYETEGSSFPLVFVPPAFGHAGIRKFPELAKVRSVIAVDLQGYGRTADIPARPMSIEQHVQDVVELLKQLKIKKADFFGESYGAAIVTMIAIKHPELVRRVATYGGTFGPPEVAIDAAMLKSDSPPTADAKSFSFQRESYEKVAPHPEYWGQFWGKVVSMKWNGFASEDLSSIKVPMLIALGDHDFVRLDHAVDTFHRIPGAKLAVIPDAGHFSLYSEPGRILPVVVSFLEQPDARLPIGTGQTGYVPGETR